MGQVSGLVQRLGKVVRYRSGESRVLVPYLIRLMYVLAAASHSRERRAENGDQARQVPRNGILKQVEERDSVSFKG